MSERVVITGMGATTPVGIGVDNFWAALKEGKCGYGEAKGYSTEGLRVTIAAEIDDFQPHLDELPKHIRQADKYSQYIGVAAIEAMKHAGFTGKFENGHRAAAIVGNGSGGITTLEKGYKDLFKHNVKRTHPLTLLRALGSSAATQ